MWNFLGTLKGCFVQGEEGFRSRDVIGFYLMFLALRPEQCNCFYFKKKRAQLWLSGAIDLCLAKFYFLYKILVGEERLWSSPDCKWKQYFSPVSKFWLLFDINIYIFAKFGFVYGPKPRPSVLKVVIHIFKIDFVFNNLFR